jgi:hypothetical protein
MVQRREPTPQMNAAGFPPLISAGNPWPPPPSWVKLPPLTQAEQGENGVFDNDSPLPQNRGHAADRIRRLGGLRKSTQAKRLAARLEKYGIRAAFFGSPAAPRLTKPFGICSSILKTIMP